jgi:formylglycine-generating enzyme required for sulfatase activity
MPFSPGSDYWLEIPAGRHRVGLTADEARTLARESADAFRARGIDLSPNEGKMMRQAATMLDTTGSAAWVERHLWATAPAREVELPAFAIARRPITNREYREFMADTGETQLPRAWARDRGNSADALPARGVSWWLAKAIAEWAGARLPFGAEWERAARGTEHRLFPWGNEFSPLGGDLFARGYEYSQPAERSRTAEGFLGALTYGEEWCAELVAGDWSRTAAGARPVDPIVPSAIGRVAMGNASYAYQADTALVRLVRGDGLSIEAPSPSTPPRFLAVGPVRAFESRILRPAIERLRGDRVGGEHDVVIDPSGNYHSVAGAVKLWLAANPASTTIGAWVPDEPTAGLSFVAVSRETVRRIPKEHGLFLWCVQYRVDSRGDARARPITAFRMAFDRRLHRFESRFRPDEVDTRVEELTPDLVRTSILDAFHDYEMHADSDDGPR